MDLHDALRLQQRHLAGIFSELSDEQFAKQSLCSEFTIHLVLAHLVAQHSTSVLKRGLTIARHRRNRPLAQLELAQKVGAASSAALLEQYVGLIEHSEEHSPKLVTQQLADTVIHTVDVCRPLGLAVPMVEFDFATVLSFLASDTALLEFVAAPLPNVTFVATNAAWRAGRGPEVTGASLDLALAMTARPNATRGLSGPGVESVAQWARVHRR
jgi:uncharacterized protein (TIGR03083 family)